MAIPTIDMTRTGQNINTLRQLAGISVKDLQDVFGFATPQAIYKWQHGISMPTIDNLYALSELFQVPIDAIVRGNRSPITSNIVIKTKGSQERRVYAYYERISEKRVA